MGKVDLNREEIDLAIRALKAANAALDMRNELDAARKVVSAARKLKGSPNNFYGLVLELIETVDEYDAVVGGEDGES